MGELASRGAVGAGERESWGSKSSPVSEIHVWENTHPLPIAHSLHEQPLSTRCRSS